MPSRKLTDRFAASKEAIPPQGRVVYFDTEVPGFALRVTANGARSWIFLYRIGKGRGPKHTMTFGDVETITVADAREIAREARGKALKSEDPQAERKARQEQARIARARSISVSECIAEYFKTKIKPNNLRSAGELRKLFTRHVERAMHDRPLGKRPLRDVTRLDIIKLLDDMRAAEIPVQANRVLTALKPFFSWCVERRYIEDNPVAGIKKPTSEVSRDRVLSDDELRLVWLASESLSPAYQAWLRILILTGARKAETALARWPHVDLRSGVWRIPGSIAKNGKEHRIALSPLATSVFQNVPKEDAPSSIVTKPGEGRFVFSTTAGLSRINEFTRTKRRLDLRIHALKCEHARNTGLDLDSIEPMPHWVFHDLRRTVGTGMARIGIPPYVVELVLNHTPREIKGVAAVYNQHRYQAEKADAWDRWANHVSTIISGDPALPLNVVQMKLARVAK